MAIVVCTGVNTNANASVSVTLGSDLSHVVVPLGSDLTYVGNDSNNILISASATPLINGIFSKSYTITNLFDSASPVVSGNAAVTVSNLKPVTANTSNAVLGHSSQMAFDLSSLKYGYAGTYTTKITYVLDDGH